MDISELKNKVDIVEIGTELGIVIDKRSQKACCPFHQDKTPSLQFSREKQIATCFSSNCSAGTMDVIQLVEKKLNLTTHESLKFLQNSISDSQLGIPNSSVAVQGQSINYENDFQLMQSSFLSSSTARNYLAGRSIDHKLFVSGDSPGYNSFKNSRFSYLRGCVIFPLKNNQDKIVSLYGRSVRDNDKAKHYYTKNRAGLFPSYPKQETKKLILTESVIDAVTLLQIESITKEYEVLALYGTNGLTTEHINAIQRLELLQDIVLFFDGDSAGREANKKQGAYLIELLPNIKISIVETLENVDINSIAIAHDNHKIFTKLLNERTLFLSEGKVVPTVREITKEEKSPLGGDLEGGLHTTNPHKLTYSTELANYFIKGGIRKDLDSLKVTLVIEHKETLVKSRNKLDLYEDKQTEKVAREASVKLDLRHDILEIELNHLTDLLDEYREQAMPVDNNKKQEYILSGTERKECVDFLKKPNLIKEVNELIGKRGVVGEENNRIFLFVIASSYKMEDTLHALIQGSSGSGKTHLLATIMDFMPPEDTISLTRVTESSFYNYGEYELQNKLLGMEDFDGLEEKAELAFRELQSKGMISSSTSGKNEATGEVKGFIKKVYGPIASMSATTRGEVYEDNMSRCFLVAVDESVEQTARIIKHQNQRAAGKVSEYQEKEIEKFLQNCMRILKPSKVINPFADKIDLPSEAHKIRRLNDLFQSFIKQITLLNQYQRSRDKQGRIITQKQDIQTAIEIMFDSILLKVDELDGSLRDFYERLKSYVKSKGESYEFEQREIRQEFRISKSQMQRNINALLDLEYISKSYVGTRNTYGYKISYWDNMSKLRERIKEDLNKQLAKI